MDDATLHTSPAWPDAEQPSTVLATGQMPKQIASGETAPRTPPDSSPIASTASTISGEHSMPPCTHISMVARPFVHGMVALRLRGDGVSGNDDSNGQPSAAIQQDIAPSTGYTEEQRVEGWRQYYAQLAEAAVAAAERALVEQVLFDLTHAGKSHKASAEATRRRRAARRKVAKAKAIEAAAASVAAEAAAAEADAPALAPSTAAICGLHWAL